MRAFKEAADSELKAALLQKAVAWRSLTGEQQYRLALALRPFAGEKIDVIIYSRDLEAWAFADQIEVALGRYPSRAPWNAHWDVHFAQIEISPRLTSGIFVEVVPKATKRDRDAADALAKALRSTNEGVIGPADRPDALSGETVRGDVGSPAPIFLTIGVHPPPPRELVPYP